jgi:hypothetical protein
MRKTVMANLLVFAGCFATILVPRAAAQNKATVASKIDFRNTGMGELKDEDGVHLGFTNFTGSDGSKLTVLYESFGSSEEARSYLEKQISQSGETSWARKEDEPGWTNRG